jgi:hypothetical protein
MWVGFLLTIFGGLASWLGNLLARLLIFAFRGFEILYHTMQETALERLGSVFDLLAEMFLNMSTTPSQYLAGINYLFPISTFLADFAIYAQLMFAVFLYRLVKSHIPFMSG